MPDSIPLGVQRQHWLMASNETPADYLNRLIAGSHFDPVAQQYLVLIFNSPLIEDPMVAAKLTID